MIDIENIGYIQRHNTHGSILTINVENKDAAEKLKFDIVNDQAIAADVRNYLKGDFLKDIQNPFKNKKDIGRKLNHFLRCDKNE